MIKSQLFEIENDIIIILEREEDLCCIKVIRCGKDLISLEGINSKDVRNIIEVLKDSPYIFSSKNKLNK